MFQAIVISPYYEKVDSKQRTYKSCHLKYDKNSQTRTV